MSHEAPTLSPAPDRPLPRTMFPPRSGGHRAQLISNPHRPTDAPQTPRLSGSAGRPRPPSPLVSAVNATQRETPACGRRPSRGTQRPALFRPGPRLPLPSGSRPGPQLSPGHSRTLSHGTGTGSSAESHSNCPVSLPCLNARQRDRQRSLS